LKKRVEKEEIIGEGEIYISQSNDKIKIDLNISEKLPITEDDIIPPLFKEKLPSNALLLETPIFTPLNKGFFGEISIYDFDPKLCKKATPITGKAELEEDGSNLSIVLKNIIEQNGEKRKLLNLITHLLPFVNKINVEKFADKSLLFKLQEKYYKKEYIPASLISDGTINITALIIALYFEKKPFVIIEEPERNIHPYLISKIVEFIKDASQNKQIIVTTHNPEFVKWAGLDNLLLVSRENKGFSKIYRPMEKKEILNFLENDIGIDELYIQNLLS
jgi:AAA15 family ATPase/GTPase